MRVVIPLGLFFLLILFSCNQANLLDREDRSEQVNNKEQLIALLDTIWTTEQDPIRLRDSLGKVHGYESPEFQKQDEIYHKNHEVNELRVLKLLDSQGWPDKTMVGDQGHLTICNVLQHSSVEIRKEYLPLMRQAVKENGLAPRLLARSEDRLATDRGDLQIYGGQIKYYPETKSFNVWPIKDPENVDKRRAEIGLEPMADFLANLRNPLQWDLNEQIKRTEEFESEQNKERE